MADFQVKAPDGHVLRVDAPDQTQAIAKAKRMYAPQAPDPNLRGVPQEPGVEGPTATVEGQGLDIMRAAKLGLGIEQPESASDYALMVASTAPLIFAGGLGAEALATRLGLPAVAKAAPFIGRMAVSAGLGGMQAANRGDDVLWGMFLDAVAGGLAEGAVSVGTSGAKVAGVKVGLKAMGEPARAFKWAGEAPDQALEAIKARLPKGKWVNAPSLDPKPITPEDAVRKLASTKGPDYAQARAELAHEFTRLDSQRVATGTKPFAGGVFKQRTPGTREMPSGFSRFAEGTRGAFGSAPFRSFAESVADLPTQGVPLGVLGAGATIEHTPGIGRMIGGDEEDEGRRRGGY